MKNNGLRSHIGKLLHEFVKGNSLVVARTLDFHRMDIMSNTHMRLRQKELDLHSIDGILGLFKTRVLDGTEIGFWIFVRNFMSNLRTKINK